MPAETLDTVCVETQEQHYKHILEGEDVVISGISCRLPESDNIEEFKQHLMNSEDMVTEDNRRWEPGLHGLPKRSGKIKDLSKFDAAFFGVSPKQANAMDPQLRMLLEVTYEALVDAGVPAHESPVFPVGVFIGCSGSETGVAWSYDTENISGYGWLGSQTGLFASRISNFFEFKGINLQNTKGSHTGVFVGVSGSEAGEVWSADPETLIGYSMTGCQRAMFANRLSFFFDLKGPSFTLDTACSSSLLAMDQALLAIRTGQCESAIVAGSNLCLKPTTALQFMKLGMLSPEGACKSFDESGNGYCRSEGVIAIYLQKVSSAKRVYATVLHSKSNADGKKKQGITFPSGEVQKQLLDQVYKEAHISPKDVVYVEAHGTGTKAGDPQEVNTISEVFCKDRSDSLMIGSVKSNMGHAEPASGLAAVAKVIVAMEEKFIPANLHYQTPNPDIPSLADGRLQVVTEKTQWNGGLVGVNSFGFGGANVHTVLKSNDRGHVTTHIASSAPRLFTFSARTQEGLEHTFNKVHLQSTNVELHSLLQENTLTPTSTHPYRGYTVLNTEGRVQEIKQCSSTEQRPVWFVFAGMGTQWHGMGRDLMKLEMFKNSILRSDAVLKPLGVHLYDLLMKGDEDVYCDTVNSFVGIAAIQVALVDLLKAMGITPDGILGHSVGELGCGYADGSLTAEETVLAAYWRGRCIKEADLEPGGMAAVGLTWEETKQRCPEGVVPACHNSEDTVTISGPKDKVATFVQELQKQGIFAKEVQSAGVAFHSYYMAKIAPRLKQALQKVILDPKPRTKRWISSSIPENAWHSDLAQYSSADYHVNNLVSPVLFQEALKHVPRNAVTIEIAPHCLLQAILKRSLGAGCEFIGLQKRLHQNNLEFFLANIGKCYMSGLNLNSLKLYPSVHYPVPSGTPMVSPFIQWDHSQKWMVPSQDDFLAMAGGSGKAAEYTYEVDVSPDSKDHYLLGHAIDGRVLFPATGYLVLAWRALAKMKGKLYEEMPVCFENINIHRATILPKTGTVTLTVNIMKSTGDFEICENDSLTVAGRISTLDEDEDDSVEPREEAGDEEWLDLDRKDVYKELRLRGYDYRGAFQGIVSANNEGNEGLLEWTGNWVSFLDTMLQMSVLGISGRSLRLPTRITSVKINPARHVDFVKQSEEGKNVIKVIVDDHTHTCHAGGVEMLGLHATVAPKRQQQSHPVLEEYSFVPYEETHLQPDIQLQKYSNDLQKLVIQSVKNCAVSDKFPDHKVIQNLLDDYDKCEPLNEEEMMKYDQNPEYTAFHVLQKAFAENYDNPSFDNFSNIVNSSKQNLENDPLLNSVCCPRYLKPCLDVILENVVTSKLKIVEFGTSESCIYKHVIPLLDSHPTVHLDYKTALHNPDEAAADMELYNVHPVKFNLNAPSTVIPDNLQSSHLVVANQVLHKEADIDACLSKISNAVSDDGFLLVIETTHNFPVALALSGLTDNQEDNRKYYGEFLDEYQWLELFQENGYEVVAQKSDQLMNTVFLCRKHTTNAEPVFLSVNDAASYDWVDELKCYMQEENKTSRVWLVADKAYHSGVVGMVNCLRREPGGESLRCIFHSDFSADSSLPDLSVSGPEMTRLLRKDLVMNVYRDGVWGSYRHLPIKQGPNELIRSSNAYVNVLTKGDLSSLHWIESPLKYFTPDGASHKQLCQVYYASLNFRDVMLATGKLPPDAIPGDLSAQDCLLGMEFSGRNGAGQRIMGLLPAKGLATTVDADSRFLWEVPPSWSLEDAASVPVVYATVYYALVVRGRIRQGERVLIHSGSGGVGQAAISVALHLGCEVYTTVGSVEKKEYLKQRFPQLKDKHFSNSRDVTFEKDILKATKGRGVNVVLNSLAEEKLQASVRLLAQHGRFLEIGKFDLSKNSALGMSIFLKNITFHGILLDALFEAGNPDWQEVAALVTKGIQDGAVKPLRTTTFDKDKVEEAFRFMAQGKHIGKVVIKVRDEEPESVSKPSHISIPVIPRSFCDPAKVYIITGGLGGFGLELAQWLVDRGATKLVLTSRSGIRNGYQARCIRLWRRKGIHVEVSKKNIRTVAETTELINEAMEMGPVGGLFHLAMVLKDGFFENQTPETFQQVGEPKVAGTHHLDQVTRQLCASSLEWFVVFSSVSCGRGNAGQANYGFANSVMERICEQRRHDGLPGLAVQWGAVGDVGIVLDNMGDNDTVIGGTLPQRISSCLATLDQFLNQPKPVVSSFVPAQKESGHKSDVGSNKVNLVEAVAHILGVSDPSTVSPNTSLADLGLDSLMGVEIKQTLERDYDVNLSMKDIRSLTVNKLHEISGSLKQSNEKPAPDSKVSVLKTAHTRYDLKQLMPSECLIKMKDVEGSERAIFLVHPIEGVVKSLEDLASCLPSTVYGLQCTSEVPVNSVEEMAKFYIKQIHSIQPEGPYKIAGYSFGACIAFEMATQLQDSTSVDLVLLDGSHAFVAAHTQLYRAKMAPGSEADAESGALCAFVQQFISTEYTELKHQLLSKNSLVTRLDNISDLLLQTGEFSNHGDLTTAALSFYQKLVAADAYSPRGHVTGDVLLVKAQAQREQGENLGYDYGLVKVCDSQVRVCEVPGDHETFIQGENAGKVAAFF